MMGIVQIQLASQIPLQSQNYFQIWKQNLNSFFDIILYPCNRLITLISRVVRVILSHYDKNIVQILFRICFLEITAESFKYKSCAIKIHSFRGIYKMSQLVWIVFANHIW